jgi:probable rRNA maturation factor
MNNGIHFFNSKIKFVVQDKSGLKRWITEVIRESNKIPGEISFIITNDKVLQEINLKYLNTNTYTDIITFTLSEEEEIISGDVYLSIERIFENSKKYKVTIEEEFRRILIHGILHLLGYEDSSAKEKRQMTRLENKYLKSYRGI